MPFSISVLSVRFPSCETCSTIPSAGGSILVSWTGGTNPVTISTRLNGLPYDTQVFTTGSGSTNINVSSPRSLCAGSYDICGTSGGVTSCGNILIPFVEPDVVVSASRPGYGCDQAYIDIRITGAWAPYYIRISELNSGNACCIPPYVYDSFSNNTSYHIPVPSVDGNNNYAVCITGSINGINIPDNGQEAYFCTLFCGIISFAVNCQQCQPILITYTSTQETCGLSNGSITPTVTGGTGSFAYLWTSLLGFTSTSKDISGLPADTYTLLVDDSDGCTNTVTVTIPNDTSSCVSDKCYLITPCDETINPFIVRNPVTSPDPNPVRYVGNYFSGSVTLIGANQPLTGCFNLLPIDCNPQAVQGSLIHVDFYSYNTCEECLPDQCWKLTNCLNSSEYYFVTTDLTDLVGSVINDVVIDGSPAPSIDSSTCFTVTNTDPCGSSYTLESHSTPFPDCECCLPSNQSPQLPPARVIPAPVKRFYQVSIPECDIQNIKSFATGYYSLFKALKFGITSCCTSYDLEALWLSNELTELSFLNIPEVTCIKPPVTPCNPCGVSLPPCSCHGLNPCPGLPVPWI